MELLQLKYFQTVAKYEHISNAAKELNISQPSLSIMISRLEDELGTPLFHRSGRNIRLNEFGKIFIKYVNQILSNLDSAKLEIRELAEIYNKKVSLAVTSTSFLSGLLKDFLTLNPDAKIRQLVDSNEKIKNYLIEGKIDFCITSPPLEGEGIECVTLLNDEILLVVPANHKYANCNSIKLKEVANEPFISLVEGHSMRELTDNLCNLAGFKPNVVFEGDAPLISELLKLGSGISLIPKSFCPPNKKYSSVFLKIEAPICKRQISLCWLKGKFLPQTAKSFRDFVIEYYKEKDIP